VTLTSHSRSFIQEAVLRLLNQVVLNVTKLNGVLDNSAMTSAQVNRTMEVYAPEGFALPPTVADTVTDNQATRDRPGNFRDFGATFLRSTGDPAIPGSAAEGMPKYTDYDTAQGVVTALNDNWEPLLR